MLLFWWSLLFNLMSNPFLIILEGLYLGLGVLGWHCWRQPWCKSVGSGGCFQSRAPTKMAMSFSCIVRLSEALGFIWRGLSAVRTWRFLIEPNVQCWALPSTCSKSSGQWPAEYDPIQSRKSLARPLKKTLRACHPMKDVASAAKILSS